MTKKQRALFVLQRLEEEYPETKIPLQHGDTYTLLIAVLLSAQSTDKRVNQVTPRLFELAKTPSQMIKLSPSSIEKIIRPCGLAPKKSQAIHKLSQIIIDEHEDRVPEDFDKLEELPGVGHKTASVVMSQGFNHPAFPVDTHIHRLSQLWGLTSGKNVRQTEKDLKSIFPQEKWNKLHLQIIYWGREYCQARRCRGISCDICRTLYPKRKQPVEYRHA